MEGETYRWGSHSHHTRTSRGVIVYIAFMSKVPELDSLSPCHPQVKIPLEGCPSLTPPLPVIPRSRSPWRGVPPAPGPPSCFSSPLTLCFLTLPYSPALNATVRDLRTRQEPPILMCSCSNV